MLSRAKQQQFKSEVIDRSVQKFFELHAVETYLGQVRLSDVVAAVKDIFSEFDYNLTKSNREEVFDAVRDYGPDGETDNAWLRIYNSTLQHDKQAS